MEVVIIMGDGRVKRRLLEFIEFYNAGVQLIRWRFTIADFLFKEGMSARVKTPWRLRSIGQFNSNDNAL